MVLLDEAELAALPAMLPRWAREGNTLVRTIQFGDFSAAWGFMSRVALLAETHGHHPDWSNSYGAVTLRFTTHDAGGLTERDTRMAAAVDAIAPA